MTNKDKFLRDGVSVEELADTIAEHYDTTDDSFCVSGMIQEFFNAPAKPTLTEDERVILRNLPREWKYINRIDGRICIKQELEDSTNLGINYLFPDLFQFIKERRRIRDRGVAKMKMLDLLKKIESGEIKDGAKFYGGDLLYDLVVVEKRLCLIKTNCMELKLVDSKLIGNFIANDYNLYEYKMVLD